MIRTFASKLHTKTDLILFFVILFVIFILIFGVFLFSHSQIDYLKLVDDFFVSQNNNISNCENMKTDFFKTLNRFALALLSLFRCYAHSTRCLLFENRSVTKQFVVSHKVDKFQM